jgi:hypothetical protein
VEALQIFTFDPLSGANDLAVGGGTRACEGTRQGGGKAVVFDPANIPNRV